MNKNDVFELDITGLGKGGEGIGHFNGMTFFVSGALPGDRVLAHATKLKKTYGYARVEKLIKGSADRVESPCPVSGRCGGCALMELSYKAQLAVKETIVEDDLVRIGGFDRAFIEGIKEPIIGMTDPLHYRNKALIPVGELEDGRIVTGFYARHSHRIVEPDVRKGCLIGSPDNGEICHAIRSWMYENKVHAYDERSEKGLVRHILIRHGKSTGQVMVCLIINGRRIPASDNLVKRLLSACPDIKSICININRQKGNTVLGEHSECIWGEPAITDRVGGISFDISANSFFQVNPDQMERLYTRALDYASLEGSENVYDLYCGIGTISLFLARSAGYVTGVEVVPDAIKDAVRNARLNGFTNTSFYTGRTEDVLPKLISQGRKADVIVLDPPRKGAEPEVIDTIKKSAPSRIVYVSCDPATLARDLALLCEDGAYQLVNYTPVDQFPESTHVETVVLLSQQKPDDTIEIDLDLDELDATSAELKATYQEIKDYVLKEFGLKVSNLYISQVKRKCGIEVGENYNLPKSENARVPQCPKEKEDAIKAALKYFAMI
ncbi:MAG: 23S rRNA (uracil(1939)-C(5))-methyltransferase RlmD [Lachnospiraceae bacterium]|nr:23S rRNA (uracil(1939)-C(5))-methyltransferase RlmD [Lachnospiraceae bacterium]